MRLSPTARRAPASEPLARALPAKGLGNAAVAPEVFHTMKVGRFLPRGLAAFDRGCGPLGLRDCATTPNLEWRGSLRPFDVGRNANWPPELMLSRRVHHSPEGPANIGSGADQLISGAANPRAASHRNPTKSASFTDSRSEPLFI